jgi:hypothetical protein
LFSLLLSGSIYLRLAVLFRNTSLLLSLLALIDPLLLHLLLPHLGGTLRIIVAANLLILLLRPDLVLLSLRRHLDRLVLALRRQRPRLRLRLRLALSLRFLLLFLFLFLLAPIIALRTGICCHKSRDCRDRQQKTRYFLCGKLFHSTPSEKAKGEYNSVLPSMLCKRRSTAYRPLFIGFCVLFGNAEYDMVVSRHEMVGGENG